MTAGIHEVFRGSTFFFNAGVGKINKNLNIEYQDAPLSRISTFPFKKDLTSLTGTSRR